ncbi:hypothetical protein KJ359_005170 [Pestalotiopsis sp. 9143b]|nr:hypothetical protein KJ359_005170 [Pestalotiopsis sp. 9143b]
MIKEKIEAGPTNAPGNPANIAINQAITEFATLESQHTDKDPNLNKLNVSPEIKKWKAVYRLGLQLNRFVEAYGKGAIWVIPFNALEAAFSRGLDSANAIYVTVFSTSWHRTRRWGSFITKLGARTRDTFLPLSKAEPADRLTRLVEMETELEAFAIENRLAKSQALFNIIAPGSIIKMSEAALRSAFMSEGSEASLDRI